MNLCFPCILTISRMQSQETDWSGVKGTRREDYDVPDRAVVKCRRSQGKYS